MKPLSDFHIITRSSIRSALMNLSDASLRGLGVLEILGHSAPQIETMEETSISERLDTLNLMERVSVDLHIDFRPIT